MRPVIDSANAARSLPDTRTIPIPARPGAVAIAAIVSLRVIGGEYSSPLSDYALRAGTRFARSSFLLMCHCCAIDRMLFTSQ